MNRYKAQGIEKRIPPDGGILETGNLSIALLPRNIIYDVAPPAGTICGTVKSVGTIAREAKALIYMKNFPVIRVQGLGFYCAGFGSMVTGVDEKCDADHSLTFKFRKQVVV